MLKIRSLTKTFFPGTPNEVRALRGIDLDLADGCFAAIIGTNGSGKSTLLNAVAGAFLPDTGTLGLGGDTITDWPEHRRATLVGRVFQNPFAGTAAEMSIEAFLPGDAEIAGAVLQQPVAGLAIQAVAAG